MGAGILIETANPFLNVRAAYDLLGRRETPGGAKALLAVWAAWVPIRLALPIYLCWGMYAISVSDSQASVRCPAVPAS